VVQAIDRATGYETDEIAVDTLFRELLYGIDNPNQ
jgi:hypothetical protein